MKQIINDIVEINRLRRLGLPEWRLSEIAEQMVKNWEWLY